MTTDREMLEFAAKACGIEQTGYSDVIGVQYVNGSEDSPYTDYFNPLNESKDFAAMCAKLEISTNWYSVDGIRESILWSVMCSLGPFQVYEAKIKDHNNDRESAWRYAATIVAAKIGGMK